MKKEEIRKEIKNKRERMEKEEWKEKSIVIQNKFLSTLSLENFSCVLTYVNVDREVKTDLIIKTALSNGKIICVPKIDWIEKIFIPVKILSFSDIDFNKKIPQPKNNDTVSYDEINLSITPGIVFDIYGNRIGRGEGFYDKFFQNLKNVFKVALAFDFQVLEDKLPVKEYDSKVDLIITEKRIIRC
ncbi:MAG TPA: 5-formyltetrahydrofolate cyclo-ligase [Candidatus Ratteibacteria bacterium]|nr:5-formyltetrahydrofolate cyclo-ligase [Candidatus Ratteibacteria bacterium]